MNKFMILAMFAILAGTSVVATTGFMELSSAIAQMADNATMGNMTAGNMTAGNMTDGNMTDAVGTISRAHR
jgi:hypothetical protein